MIKEFDHIDAAICCDIVGLIEIKSYFYSIDMQFLIGFLII